MFVTIEHAIEGAEGVVIYEEQDLVYRTSSRQSATDGDANDAGDVDAWKWKLELSADSVALFRFSALTYNAHRIHYDRSYTVEREGFPGLVVQGPYQAIGLAELCRRNDPDVILESFQFRAVRAAFDGEPLRLRGNPGRDIELVAYDSHNRQTMTAVATLRD
jgi:3-methylfumaryl-CoA hydratase